jgi:hypothetical protein
MRKSLFLLLSLSGLALLAACGSRQSTPIVVVPPQAQPAPVVTGAPAASAAPAVVQSVAAVRPGMGRIESIAPAATASAGGTAASPMQRLNIRMDDGSMQVIDTPSPGFAIGDRVELTREGYIRRIPA